MTTAFDPMKAVREELAGMAEILAVLRRREHIAEAAIAEAENELNAIRKLRGYAEIARGQLREKLMQLEREATK